MTRMRRERTRSPRMETSSTRMTTKKKRTTRKTFSAFLETPRHPIPPLNHPITRGMLRFAMLVCVLATARVPGMAAGDKKQNNTHAHDFVIFADVYTDHGFALPGAKVRVRRSDERKFRWEAISDTRVNWGLESSKAPRTS